MNVEVKMYDHKIGAHTRHVRSHYSTRNFAVTECPNVEGVMRITHTPTGCMMPGLKYNADLPAMRTFCDWLDEAYDWSGDEYESVAVDLAAREGIAGTVELRAVLNALWESAHGR